MDKKYSDIVTGCVFLVLSVFLYITSLRIADANVSKLGPDFMPKIVAIGIGILSIIIIVNGIRRYKEMGVDKSEIINNKSKEKINKKNVIFTLLLLSTYVLFLDKIGFIIMTILYMLLQLTILSDDKTKHIKKFAAISIITTLTLYSIFVYGFNILIPAGILG